MELTRLCGTVDARQESNRVKIRVSSRVSSSVSIRVRVRVCHRVRVCDKVNT